MVRLPAAPSRRILALMADTVLELRGVTRRFGAVTAVDRLSEQLHAAEYFCILGPSGCGKTTLLRLVAGFETPDEGSILIHGRDVLGVPPERRDTNVVFQSFALFPHLTVRENIGFGLRMRRLPRQEIGGRVDEMIRLVGLEREADRLPRQLSGGQQQRVALGRALVNRPAVLLLDEPLSALDQSLRQRMQEELRAIQRNTGVAFLHITHDQAEALSLADRVAVMRAGRFEQVAAPRELYRTPATRFVAEFVGGTNLLSGRRDGADVVLLPRGTRVGPLVHPSSVPGDDVSLAVRPESLTFAATDSAHVVGRVVHAAFVGAAVEYSVLLDDDDLVLRVRAPADQDALPAEGDRVGIRIVPASVTVLPPA
jgi:spermidine/putrescine ABC transporter ATP-binding subunit